LPSCFPEQKLEKNTCRYETVKKKKEKKRWMIPKDDFTRKIKKFMSFFLFVLESRKAKRTTDNFNTNKINNKRLSRTL
jgi:hypothetical protein